MGFRFDLRAANWIAYLVQDDGHLPHLGGRGEEVEALHTLLYRMERSFFSSYEYRGDFSRRVERAIHVLDRVLHDLPHGQFAHHVSGALSELREFFSKRPWTALFVPSGTNPEIDSFLSSEELLQRLVEIRPADPGLILQLQEPPGERFSLTDVFPAFKTALAHSNQWPGVLVWTNSGDSQFFPLPKKTRCIMEQTEWLFSHLATAYGVDLELLKAQYNRTFPEARTSRDEAIIIQLSDLHIGSREASRRLPRVQQLVRNLITEIGDQKRFIFAVTGDLMNSPDERYLDSVRAFIDFLNNLGAEAVLTCLGNHDVRKDGYLAENLRMAMRLPQTNTAVTWIDDLQLGLVTFNSVVGGKLARGFIGESQLLDIGSELDRKKDVNHYRLIGLLHHHPVPVEVPEWYSRPFYEKLFGSEFERTDSLEDERRFTAFVEQRRFRCILHGHKHIPHISHTAKKVPVFGCGSSVGKVEAIDGGIYMSVNVVSLDVNRSQLTARLMAERIAGAGLVEEKRHELISRA